MLGGGCEGRTSGGACATEGGGGSTLERARMLGGGSAPALGRTDDCAVGTLGLASCAGTSVCDGAARDRLGPGALDAFASCAGEIATRWSREEAPAVLDRLRGRLRPAAEAEEEDVDAVRVGQLAEAKHGRVRTFGIGVDDDDPRPLYGDAREEHRERHVDDHVSARAQRRGDLLRLSGGIAHEDRLFRARGFFPHPNSLALLRRRLVAERSTDHASGARQQAGQVDQPEDERRQGELSVRVAVHHDRGS